MLYQTFVKTLTGRSITLSYNAATTVGDLKKAFADKEGLQYGTFRLILSPTPGELNNDEDLMSNHWSIKKPESATLTYLPFLTFGNATIPEFMAGANTRHQAVTLQQVQEFVKVEGYSTSLQKQRINPLI